MMLTPLNNMVVTMTRVAFPQAEVDLNPKHYAYAARLNIETDNYYVVPNDGGIGFTVRHVVETSISHDNYTKTRTIVLINGNAVHYLPPQEIPSNWKFVAGDQPLAPEDTPNFLREIPSVDLDMYDPTFIPAVLIAAIQTEIDNPKPRLSTEDVQRIMSDETLIWRKA